MSEAGPSDRRGVHVSVVLASRSVSPGDRTSGAIELLADRACRVSALRVTARVVRRERRAGEVQESALPVSAALSLGAFSLNPGASREVPFTLPWPRDLASSVPNQLDYDLVVAATTDDGPVEANVRVLVFAPQGGDNATLPVGPAWVASGTSCEAEDDHGAWRPAEIESVHGLMVLVRWRDGGPAAWLPLRRLREGARG